MTKDEQLDKIEQGIDNLSEVLDIKQTELVEIIIKGFYRKQRNGVKEKYVDFLDKLYFTFKEFE